MARAERAARALYRSQPTRDRADHRIAMASVTLRAVALQQRTREFRVGDYMVRVGEDVTVIERIHHRGRPTLA